MNTCTICGKEMKFVEGDIIHDENWYHGICVKIKKKPGWVFALKEIR